MEDKAIRGIRWTLLAYAATRGLSIVTTLILARLLVPSDFGIVAFGTLFVTLAGYAAGIGLAPAIVVRQDLTSSQLGTAFAMLVGLNLLCAAAVAAASPLLADALGSPGADGVIAVLSLSLVLGSPGLFYGALMQRELKFRPRFVGQAGQTVAMTVTALALAVAGAGVWSLVAGQIAAALVSTALFVALAPYRVPLTFDASAVRDLWHSGRGFMLQGGASFIEQNADYAVVGGALGARPLGIYSVAYRLSEVPYTGIVDPIGQATFPGFARMRHREEDVSGPFLTSLRFITLCAFPLGLILSAAADPVVEVLGSQWIGMAGVLGILGLWGSLRTIQGITGWFVNAIGLSWHIGASYAVMLVISIPLLVLAANASGLEAVAWVMVGNVIAMTAIVSTLARRGAGVSLAQQWAAVRPAVVASVAAWLATFATVAATEEVASLVALVLSVIAGALAYVVAVLAIDRRLPGEARRQLIRAIGPVAHGNASPVATIESSHVE